MSKETIRQFKVTIGGRQLLMHNGQLADPLNAWAKALKERTSKRKKSDEDHTAIAEAEFQGGLYFDEKLGPYIPGHVIDAALIEGAKKNKLGKVFASCVHTTDDAYALDYKGPRTRDGLWADSRFHDRRGAGVQTARVMRTRPKFTDWKLSFVVELFPSELNPTDLQNAIANAGRYVGIGDFRPRFGLFVVDAFEEIKTKT